MEHPQGLQPPEDREEDVRLRKARERVSELKGFYIHMAVFIAVVLLLFLVNVLSSGAWWVQWVFLGWGIGVALHAAAVFGQSPAFLAKWEERKIREYMDKR